MSTAFPDEGAARRALQVMEARRTGRETELLHRVCHELLSAAELPVVLRNALDQLATHLGATVGYVRVIDSGPPEATVEATYGLSGRELDSIRGWLHHGHQQPPARSLAGARQERQEDTLTRLSIREPPRITGVVVLDHRASTGPSALEEQRVLMAAASLIGETVRCRNDLAHTSALRPSPPVLAPPTQSAPPEPDAAPDPNASKPRSLQAMLLAFEREILVDALHDAGGNQSRAARALHTTPRILAYRLKRHGLHGVLTKAGR